MRALVVCLLIAVIGLGGRAHADDREEARKEFAAGQAADRRKDWQTALEHYLRANSLVPHPFAMFNIAVIYERLDNLREAAIWYERYLAQTTDAADRERIQRALNELIVRPAPFEVGSTPPRARVYVDAIPVGVTPYRGTIKGGFHRVSIELDGRRDHRDVTVEYAEPVRLDFVLRAATGAVRVVGAPPGATIHVGGREAGRIPARLVLPSGPHPVRITSPGYAPYETTVTVEPGREARVDARLARAGGTDGGGAPGAAGAVAPGTVPGAGGRRVIRAGYLIGFAGGADALGDGAVGLLELGIRMNQFDGGVRAGRAGGLVNVDLLVRWALLPGRLAPFFGAGYTYLDGGFGYALSGGLRWDVVRRDHAGISLLAESGLRYYSIKSSPPGEAPTEERGFIVPLMASVLVLYK